MNSKIDQILIIFQEVFQKLLNFENINGKLSYKKDFNTNSIKDNILLKLNHKCLGLSSKVIILEPGN